MAETPIPYRVSYSGLILAEVRRLIAAAETGERAELILAAFKELDRVLRIYPQFGEPEINLPHEDGVRYRAIMPPKQDA